MLKIACFYYCEKQKRIWEILQGPNGSPEEGLIMQVKNNTKAINDLTDLVNTVKKHGLKFLLALAAYHLLSLLGVKYLDSIFAFFK